MTSKISRRQFLNALVSHAGLELPEREVCAVGPAVLDTSIRPHASSKQLGDKQDCHIVTVLGGGAANTIRQVRKLGCDAMPILLCGADEGSGPVGKLARKEFGDGVLIVPQMEETRRSILVDNRCFTVRSSLADHQLPAAVAHRVARSSLTIIAPFTPADAPFVRELLRFAPRSVLQLSTAQLADRDGAFDLAKRATVVVVNFAELELWTGLADPLAGIQRVLDAGCQNVIATSAHRVLGWLNNEIIDCPVAHVERPSRTVGAGDTFVGTLAAGLLVGQPAQAVIANAVAAATEFVTSGAVPAQPASTRPTPTASPRGAIRERSASNHRNLGWAAMAATLLLALVAAWGS